MNYKLATVRSYLYEYEAELDRSKLEQAGIECFLLDQNLSNMNWGYTFAMGGMRLQVKSEDLARAKQVIGLHVEKEDTVQEHVETDVKPICPNCRSGNTKSVNTLISKQFTSWLTMLAGLLFMIAIPFRHNRWACLDCGYKWKHAHPEVKKTAV